MTAAAGNYRVWSNRDETRWHLDDIRIVGSWKHKSSYHNVHHANISLTTTQGLVFDNALRLLVWVWVWCSWMVICHKWWCLSCWRCLNGHVRFVVWTLTLCMTSSHHHYTASYLPPLPPLFTFLVGRDIIRWPPTSHFHSPRISQEPLEGHSQEDRKIELETVFWPLS